MEWIIYIGLGLVYGVLCFVWGIICSEKWVARNKKNRMTDCKYPYKD